MFFFFNNKKSTLLTKENTFAKRASKRLVNSQSTLGEKVQQNAKQKTAQNIYI